MPETTVKQCPFLNDVCIEEDCQLWVEAENQCAIINMAYSLNYTKERIRNIESQIEKNA